MIHSLPVNEFETSVDKFHHLISQAPVVIATFKGPSFVLEIVNTMALEIWGKSYEQAIHKPFFESSPEMEIELKQIFIDIYTSGNPFIAKEIQVQLNRIGKPATAFFDMVYQPLRDVDNIIYGIIAVGTEVTEAVNARNLIKSSDPISRTILESSPDCLKLLDLEGRVKYMNYNALCQMEIDDFSIVEKSSISICQSAL